MSDTTLYFAYGSNLNAADWSRWCTEQPGTEDPACMRAVGPAVLPDHELAFSRKSAARKGGVLDVRPRPGHAVEGVLMAVSPAGWRLLDIKEGVHFGAYERLTARVVDAAGAWHDITTYRVVPRTAQRHVPPHEHYVSVCAEGLRGHGLDAARLLDAAAGRPARSHAAGVFLSEPLRRAMAAVLREDEQAALEPATVSAALHESGALTRRVETTVSGTFLPCEALEDLVERLDPLAGHANIRFARDLVTVRAGGGAECRAWAYVVPEGLQIT